MSFALLTAAAVAAAGLAPTTALPATPAPALVAAAPTSWTTYTVRSGDTVGAIARRTGTSVAAVVARNSLPAGGYRIRVGQKLQVPGKSPARTGKAPARTVRAAPRAVKAPVRRSGAAAPAASRAASRSAVRSLVAATARAHGVDPRLALAVAWQESRWTQSARSSKGAVGIMQVMPANTAWLSGLAGRPLDLTVARDNATAGVLMLKYLVARAPSFDYAVGGYYQGLPSMKRRGPYAETTRYIASVKAHLAWQ